MPTILSHLASARGRNDEQPNIALADRIARTGDAAAVKELVEALESGGPPVRSDAIKVLYEVGEREPSLIAAYLGRFVALLGSRHNRLVWGAMCAIDAIAAVRPRQVLAVLPALAAAVTRSESVIARDHYVKALVKVAAALPAAARVRTAILVELASCPDNQLPMYAELATTVAAGRAAQLQLRNVLIRRLRGLQQAPKRRRVERVIAGLERALSAR